jgi:hypothetical protein
MNLISNALGEEWNNLPLQNSVNLRCMSGCSERRGHIKYCMMKLRVNFGCPLSSSFFPHVYSVTRWFVHCDPKRINKWYRYFWLIDWLIIYGFTSRSRIFHSHGDVTIAGEGLQTLGLCSALRALEQGGIFIVPHLLWHGTSVYPVSSEGPPHLVASYDTRGDVEDLF